MLIGPRPRATTLVGLTDREVGVEDGEHPPARAVELAPGVSSTLLGRHTFSWLAGDAG